MTNPRILFLNGLLRSLKHRRNPDASERTERDFVISWELEQRGEVPKLLKRNAFSRLKIHEMELLVACDFPLNATSNLAANSGDGPAAEQPLQNDMDQEEMFETWNRNFAKWITYRCTDDNNLGIAKRVLGWEVEQCVEARKYENFQNCDLSREQYELLKYFGFSTDSVIDLQSSDDEQEQRTAAADPSLSAQNVALDPNVRREQHHERSNQETSQFRGSAISSDSTNPNAAATNHPVHSAEMTSLHQSPTATHDDRKPRATAVQYSSALGADADKGASRKRSHPKNGQGTNQRRRFTFPPTNTTNPSVAAAARLPFNPSTWHPQGRSIDGTMIPLYGEHRGHVGCSFPERSGPIANREQNFPPPVMVARESVCVQQVSQQVNFTSLSSSEHTSWTHPLSSELDEVCLSKYHCETRKYIEAVEIGPAGVDHFRKISKEDRLCKGQIGIRCSLCKEYAIFPRVLKNVQKSDFGNSLYANVEAMVRHHLTASRGDKMCSKLTDSQKKDILKLKQKNPKAQPQLADPSEYYAKSLSLIKVCEGQCPEVGRALFLDYHPYAGRIQNIQDSNQGKPSRENSQQSKPSVPHHILMKHSTERAAQVLWSCDLAVDSDKDNLNAYQCDARKQIELFKATDQDILHIRENRKNNLWDGVVPGQVGLRCKHCRNCHSFPGAFSSVYVLTSNIIHNHLLNGKCHKFGVEHESDQGNGNRSDMEKLLNLQQLHRGQRPGPYSAPVYIEKCLRDIGICQDPCRKGLFLCSK